MIEIEGDIFNIDADVICIPTNGDLKKNGLAVMGAGLALEYVKRIPESPKILGQYIKAYGNHVHIIERGNKGLPIGVSFPTKEHWYERSSLELIARSCEELYEILGDIPFIVEKVLLPRVGCGLGGLKWEVVKTYLEQLNLLEDSMFVIVNKPPNEGTKGTK